MMRIEGYSDGFWVGLGCNSDLRSLRDLRFWESSRGLHGGRVNDSWCWSLG